MIGTILLTHDNKYVKADGSLPARPDFDKELLTAVVNRGFVSHEGYKLLPPSIQKVAYGPNLHYDTAITIRELAKCDLLIVTRSLELVDSDAKEFRMDAFSCVVKDRKLEIWRKL